MNQVNQKLKPTGSTVYQIRIKGHLDDSWSDWFDNLSITREPNGDTLLTGPVLDQCALYGLLKKVHDLALTLISVNPVESNAPALQKERGEK
jgi:hypothetical protein